MRTMPAIVDTVEDLVCYHCGERCEDGSIRKEEKYFCCEGCKLVYEVLEENNLCTYYNLNDTPGAAKREKVAGKRYDYLDDPEISEKLIEFKSDQLFKLSFFIPSIHCSSCIWLLENLYKIDERILNSRVDFPAKKVFIKASPTIKISEIVEILDSIGYEPRLSLDELEQKDTKSLNKSLYLKLGVAGFAFGNIMMLSFPDYLSITDSVESFMPFFNIVSVLLSLPVLFYSSSGYFISAFKGLKKKYINIDFPLSLGIAALWGRSIYDIFVLHEQGYMDSFAGLIFFLLIGKVFQNKTYEYFNFERNYKSYFPISITRRGKNGHEEVIPLSKINVKDRILIRNNEIIPADSILINGIGNIDYSFVTGESLPQVKEKGEKVFAGGKQTGGVIELEIIKEVSQSYLTRLWNDFIVSKDHDSGLINFSNVVSKYFTLGILAVALLGVLLWYQAGVVQVLSIVTAVLIVACPCALALSAPFALGNSLRIFGRNHFYLKSVKVVENLSHTDAIIFDKTGTLTENQEIDILFVPEGTAGNLNLVADGNFHPNLGRKIEDGSAKTVRIGDLAKATFKNSLHPLSKAIYRYLSEFEDLKVDSFMEYPGKGGEAFITGRSVLFGSPAFVKGENEKSENLEKSENSEKFVKFENLEVPENSARSEKSEKSEKNEINATTSVTGSKVYLSVDNQIIGYFKIENKYRKGVQAILKEVKKKNEVFILSGDNDSEKENLIKFADSKNIRFNCTPVEKMEIIEELQASGKKVLMVGDGLNDAAALSKADVGVSLSDDLMNFTPASDSLLHGDSLQHLPKFLAQARSTMTVVRTSFVISTIYNLIGVSVALAGLLSPLFAAILMPISSISVVIFTTLGTIFTAKHNGLKI
ncbi:MAG: heavy metal translocating P-type ATPase metal-binding domain-containing protein [Ignavibacteriales bacterium]|nr:MAG: HAD-IC family P-type ATPase [Ignavibacteriaceae bacterium]MBW7872298.1 heavy metal translocating P-type ATPase metal-binding domain-containing protein [Ignavibacteria bacterium]MCZ2142581.1 heavy metal translocating P-type ATPase metal-binding domain-containing protein [Ignavibacteriales bacterium]MBV6445555.1 putative copper-importing P-type ATPase A [Ignavibacteriaceae bacterium]MBZ0196950.1 heavy metal translocating P-type ATPase metal-binding domain-containing protein [Ignavibacteri